MHAAEGAGRPPLHTMPSARLEAFSDGVIAVIVTIMVLELHVPRDNGWAGFLPVLPRIAIYVLSFVMVGVYWINHHELLRRSETISYAVLWANLVFLLALSFIPFATEYVGEKHFDSVSALLYNAAMVLAALTFFGLRHTLLRMQRVHGEITRAQRAELQKHRFSIGLYCIAIPIAFVYPLVSFGLNTLVTLLWIIPEVGIRRPFEAAP